jgi:hypothetical protein
VAPVNDQTLSFSSKWASLAGPDAPDWSDAVVLNVDPNPVTSVFVMTDHPSESHAGTLKGGFWATVNTLEARPWCSKTKQPSSRLLKFLPELQKGSRNAHVLATTEY